MKRYAIIVAGGSGNRMDSETPKQFMLLRGTPVLMHTLNRFHEFDPEIGLVVVLPAEHVITWDELCVEHIFDLPHTVAHGGDERFFSVRNGLEHVPDSATVGIHDGVRPLVSLETLDRTYGAAKQLGNAIPVIPLNESLRKVDGEQSRAADRKIFRLVQTPQCFRTELIKRAYLQDFDPKFTDDASVLEVTGEKINLVEGNPENLKITTPSDFRIVEALM